jgi:hypothetical protein
MFKLLPVTLVLLITQTAQAKFYIDLQKEKPPTYQKNNTEGYKLLTGQYHGRVFQVGEPIGIGAVTSEGEDQSIEDSMFFILPSGWFAYIDEQTVTLPNVSWSANNTYFLDVLAELGKNYGMKFIVDWNQKLVQIEVNESFENPSFEQPSIITDSEGKREVYIYTKPSKTTGYLIKNGDITPVIVD